MAGWCSDRWQAPRAVDRRRHLQLGSGERGSPVAIEESRRGTSARRAARRHEDRLGLLRQEPRERPGRRARRHHLQRRLRVRRGRQAHDELRAPQPGGGRPPPQRRDHPGAAAGDGLLFLRAGGPARRADFIGRDPGTSGGTSRRPSTAWRRPRLQFRPARWASTGTAQPHRCGAAFCRPGCGDGGGAVGVPDRPHRRAPRDADGVVLLDSPAWAERRTTSDRGSGAAGAGLEAHQGRPRWYASGCRTGSRTATRSWPGSSSPRGWTAPRRVGQPVAVTSSGMRVAAEGPQDAVPPIHCAAAPWTPDGRRWTPWTPWTPWTRRCSPPTSPHVMTFCRTFRTSTEQLITCGVVDGRPDRVGDRGHGLEEPFVPFVSDVIGRRSALDSLPGGRYVSEVQAVIRDVVETQVRVRPCPAGELSRARIRAEPGPRRPRGRITMGGTGHLRRDPEEAFVMAGTRARRAGSVALERLSTHHRFAEGASAGRRGAPGDR